MPAVRITDPIRGLRTTSAPARFSLTFAFALATFAMIVQTAPLRAADAGNGGPDAGGGPQQQRHTHAGGSEEIGNQTFTAGQQRSTGSVTVNGQRIDYVAYAGTLIVHPRGWSDVPQDQPADEQPRDVPEASMFYVAYFRVPDAGGAAGGSRHARAGGAPAGAAGQALSSVGSAARPITFLYNGGPGSSTVWLHMGAFGPRRVITNGDVQTPAAPYRLVNNGDCLLDASDLVFIDAPGTGFSRIAGKDRDKRFYGVDQDAYAFSDFIVQFLSTYGRWNSPKYLFGESYGTTRSAVLANLLETDRDVDLNGVILLSQILNFDDSPDGPQFNPGVYLPYVLALPTYAATAWFHHRLPGAQGELQPLLTQVEQFATHDYALALEQGNALPAAQRQQIAQRLHAYTGLPLQYILDANLRINGGEFEKNLQGADVTTGRLDTRFSGPAFDPLSEEAEYDPQSAAISSAYVSAFNDYVRRDLHYRTDQQYKPEIDIEDWDYLHAPPGSGMPLPQATNVMPDLEIALKYDPQLRVLLNAGYYDLATPFYAGVYEMQHLRIPQSLQDNISFAFYPTGHMVYVSESGLRQLHRNVADFIRRTQTGPLNAPAAAAPSTP